MASGLALSMAEATHPKSNLTSDDPDPLYHGLFRQLMLDFRVLPALAACASSPSAGAGESSMAREMQMLTSAAISRLIALPGGQVGLEDKRNPHSQIPTTSDTYQIIPIKSSDGEH